MDEREIFVQVIQDADPARRSARLLELCGRDASLLGRVESLLDAHERAVSFLEAPPTPIALCQTLDQRPFEKIGDQVGPYKLLQEIGQGGMGLVYMAEQTEPVRRKVALKIIKPGMDTRQVIARFEAERQALAVMDHPCIAKVLDAGATNLGRPYFVMELVRGAPITTYCDENRLSVRERLELFAATCQAIQHAHTKGIIHRDIKPSNVLVTRQDGRPTVKVIDFGIAKATGHALTDKTLFTEFAQMIGTPLYMSPEQAESSGADIDTRSDIYSLGVLLYELLTGSTPFDREQIQSAALGEICRMIREDEPVKPSERISGSHVLPAIASHRHIEPARLSRLVRGELDWIVMRALEKDRSRRYETANGFFADVQRYLNDEPVHACPPSSTYRFIKFARRNKGFLAMVGVVSLALVLGIIGTAWQAHRASAQRDRAVAAELLAQTRLSSEAAALRKAVANQELAAAKSEDAARHLREARLAVDEWFTKISQTTLLEAPGLQPLRQQLLETALSYYQSLLKQAEHDAELRADVAAAYLRLSVIYVACDRNDDSLASMLQGLVLIEQLLADRPDDVELPRRIAGFFQTSRSFFQRSRPPSDPQKAVETLNRAASIWERFVAAHPDLQELQGDLAGIHLLRNALLQWRDLPEALSNAKRACELLEQLTHRLPDRTSYRELLTLAYSEQIHILGRLGRVEDAEKAGRRSIDHFDALMREWPREWSVRLGAAVVHHDQAQRLRGENPGEAERLFRRELELLELLTSESAAHASVRRQSYLALQALAALLSRDASDARETEAEECRNRARRVNEQLILEFPNAPEFRKEMARSLIEQGDRRRETQPQLAIVNYRQAVALQEQLAMEFSTDERYAEDLRHSETRLLALCQATGQVAETESLYRRILARHQSAAEAAPGNARVLRRVARYHNQLGLALRHAGKQQEAEAELNKAESLWKSLDGTAVAAARKNAEADPQNGHRWHELFIACYEEGRWEECLAAIASKQQVVGGGSAWEWFHASVCEWQLGRRELAVAQFHRAVDWMARENVRTATVRGYQSEAALLLGMPDPGARVDRAFDDQQRAEALKKTGRGNEAREFLERSREAYESLAADHPQVGQFTRKLVELLVVLGRPQDLDDACRRASAAITMPAGAPEDLRLDWANRCNDLATTLNGRGRLVDAETFVRRGLDAKTALVAEFPEKPSYVFHLAHSYLGLAYVLEKSERRDDARVQVQEAEKLFERLAIDPQNAAEFRQLNAHGLWRVGDAWLRHEQTDAARRTYEQSLAVFQQLAELIPTNRFYRQEQAFSHRLLAAADEQAGRREDAIKRMTTARDLYDRLAAEAPEEAFYVRESRFCQHRLLESYIRAKRFAEAEQAYARAAADLEDWRVTKADSRQWRIDAANLLNEAVWPSMFNADAPPEMVRLANRISQQSLEVSPDAGHLLNTLMMVEYRAGEYRRALATAEKMRKTGWKNGTSLLFEAMIHWKLGNHDQAREDYSSGVKWIDEVEPHSKGMRRLQEEARRLIHPEQEGKPSE